MGNCYSLYSKNLGMSGKMVWWSTEPNWSTKLGDLLECLKLTLVLIFLQLNGSLRHICSFKANINALLATLRNFFIENLQNFVLELNSYTDLQQLSY